MTHDDRKYKVTAEWIVEGKDVAFGLAEALMLQGAETSGCAPLDERPEGFHRGCSREGCPCHTPGPVCEECMCVLPNRSEIVVYCPRCGWSHDKHAVCGYRTKVAM